MSEWGFWDWIGFSSLTIAALVIAADAAIAQSDELKKYLPRPLKLPFMSYLPIVAILIATGAFAKKELTESSPSLPKDASIGTPFGIIQAWGVSNGSFYVVIKTDSIMSGSKLKHLVMVVHPEYANIDPISDKNIIKTQDYTIVDGFMTLATSSDWSFYFYNEEKTTVRMDLVELPFMFSGSQITSLSDLPNLSGRVLASVQILVDLKNHPKPTSPLDSCPPVLKPPKPPGKT